MGSHRPSPTPLRGPWPLGAPKGVGSVGVPKGGQGLPSPQGDALASGGAGRRRGGVHGDPHGAGDAPGPGRAVEPREAPPGEDPRPTGHPTTGVDRVGRLGPHGPHGPLHGGEVPPRRRGRGAPGPGPGPGPGVPPGLRQGPLGDPLPRTTGLGRQVPRPRVGRPRRVPSRLRETAPRGGGLGGPSALRAPEGLLRRHPPAPILGGPRAQPHPSGGQARASEPGPRTRQGLRAPRVPGTAAVGPRTA